MIPPLWQQFCQKHEFQDIQPHVPMDAPGSLTPLLGQPNHPWCRFDAISKDDAGETCHYRVDYFPARHSWLIWTDGKIFDARTTGFQPTLSRRDSPHIPGKFSPLCLMYPRSLFDALASQSLDPGAFDYYDISIGDGFYYHYESGTYSDATRSDKRNYSETIVPSIGGYAVAFRETIDNELFIEWQLENFRPVPIEHFEEFAHNNRELFTTNY